MARTEAQATVNPSAGSLHQTYDGGRIEVSVSWCQPRPQEEREPTCEHGSHHHEADDEHLPEEPHRIVHVSFHVRSLSWPTVAESPTLRADVVVVDAMPAEVLRVLAGYSSAMETRAPNIIAFVAVDDILYRHSWHPISPHQHTMSTTRSGSVSGPPPSELIGMGRCSGTSYMGVLISNPIGS